MKHFFILSLTVCTVFTLSAAIVKGPAFDQEKKVIADYEKGKISLQELQNKYRTFLQANKDFLQKKHKNLLDAQKARNAYLVKAGQKDQELNKDLPLFSSGLIRTASDRAAFMRVYAKLGKDPAFLKLDKNLWKAKLLSVIGSFERQKGVPGIDQETAAFEKASREYQEAIRKGAIKSLGNGKTFLSAEKGSILYRAALGEIENFGKKASPQEVFKARQRLSFYMRELYREFQESHPALKKAIKAQEKTLIDRNICLFKLQLANEEAAYAQYLKLFGVNLGVKGKLMNEISDGNKNLQALEKALAAGKQEVQKKTNQLLKDSKLPSANELRMISARMQLLFGKKK